MTENLKQERKYLKVKSVPGVAKVLCWCKDRKQYLPPKDGKSYLARRWEMILGGRARKAKYFATLDEARDWVRNLEVLQFKNPSTSGFNPGVVSEAPTFRGVFEDFKKRSIGRVVPDTIFNYERYIRYMTPILNMPINLIAPKTIDDLVEWMKSKTTSKCRQTFDHEITAIKSLMNHYREYWDDPTFQNPVKKRHFEAGIVVRRSKEANKDLTEMDFHRFREQLRKGKNGELLHSLATVQFYHALRISEVAALKWEDLTLNFDDFADSTIIVRRHVIYSRHNGIKPHIEPGFKNADRDQQFKILPLHPSAWLELEKMWKPEQTGFIFPDEDGGFLDYRHIVGRFNAAFKKLSLEFRGTHIMRHGGTRDVYNRTGDLAIAQQVLGNRDIKSTIVYAQRHPKALKDDFRKQWKEEPEPHLKLVASGRN